MLRLNVVLLTGFLRAPSSLPFYGRDPRVPRRGQIRDRCQWQGEGAELRRREKSAEQRRREICSGASCDGKSTQCSYRHSETEEISTGCGASGGVTKRKEAR